MAFEKARKVVGDKHLMGSIGITLLIIVLYRLGSELPVPGVPYGSVVDMLDSNGNGALASTMSVLNMFSGGSLKYISLFSLSIMPYITATIIMQILGFASPTLHKLQQQGEAGANRINQYARYLTVGLSLLNAIGYFFLFKAYGVSFAASEAPEWMLSLMFIASLIGGSLLLMYLGEKITDTQIFNGASILICVNVISSVPTAFYNSVTGTTDAANITAIVLAAIVVMVPFLVLMELGQRRIPITYARQQSVGGKFAKQTTYMPLKALAQGVVPIIFASAFTYIPLQIAVFFPDNTTLTNIASALSSGWVSWTVQAVLIVAFSFFYSLIVMRPDDTADNLAKSGAFISNPKVAPGHDTASYIKAVLIRITVPSSIILAALAIIPNILMTNTSNALLRSFGGTSLLIMIGVICQSLSAIDSQVTMSSYEGTTFKRHKRKAVFGSETDEAKDFE